MDGIFHELCDQATREASERVPRLLSDLTGLEMTKAVCVSILSTVPCGTKQVNNYTKEKQHFEAGHLLCNL